MSDAPEKPALGFIPLKSFRQGPADPAAALAEIRRIYFSTTKQTVENDFVHAIELLKNLPTEEEREKAAVFMEGISQMRREWDAADRRKKSKKPPKKAKGGPAGAKRDK